MRITRRGMLAGATATMAAGRLRPVRAAGPATLRLSHQFPSAASASEGDFRDRLCRRFAAEVEKQSGGALRFEIYPGSSLMKTNAQFSAVRKGAIDLSLYPLNNAGGEAVELNIALMPALVTSYAQGHAWKAQPVGQALTEFLRSRDVLILTWVWQAGGVAGRAKPLVLPEHAKGMKVRGGSREMDMMLQAAGAAVLSLPSNEIYAALQTGALDAALTSSTSLISFRLEEVAKHLTAGQGRAYWYDLEPLIMSSRVFDSLPKDQQEILLSVGAALEPFGIEAAKADDVRVADIFRAAKAEVHALDGDALRQWQDIAERTAWKDFADRSEMAAKLLTLARQVTA